MEIEHHPPDHPHHDQLRGIASPPPYDNMLPAPSTAHLQSPSNNQVIRNSNPVSHDTQTETPHDLYCLAKEYARRGIMPEARNLYLKASMNGHLSAMVNYASLLIDSDERSAFVWFRAAAERGDPRAWARLGELLSNGEFFESNAIDAARCWKRAAQMGDNPAKIALGLCFIRGFGVKQSPDKGIEILRQVADMHNDITAMNNLGWIYRHGKGGVPQNLTEAEYWENRAKRHKTIMDHVTSREQVLYGKSRISRHFRQKTRTATKPLTKPPEQDSDDSQQQNTRSRDTAVKTTGLVAEELLQRLQAVSEDPARIAEEKCEQVANTKVLDKSKTPIKEAKQTLEEKPQSKDIQHSVSAVSVSAPVSEFVPSFPEIRRGLEERTRGEVKTVVKKPDPKLRSAVEDLNFTRNYQGDSTTVTEVGRFNLPVAEVRAVHSTSAARLAQESATTEAISSVQNGGLEQGVAVSERVPAKASEVVDDSEEQFNTPAQSLENEEKDPVASLVKPRTAAAVGTTISALGTLYANRRQVSSRGYSSDTKPITDTEAVEGVSKINSTRATQGLVSAQIEETIGEVVAASADIRDEGLDSLEENLSTNSKTHSMPFENSRGAGDLSPGNEGSSALLQRNSYALNANNSGGSVPGNEELDEFEEADMQRIASEASGPRQTYTHDQGTTGTQGTRSVTPQKVTSFQKSVGRVSDNAHQHSGQKCASDVQTSNVLADSNDPPRYATLKNLLALYPKNPLRADSQVPLFKLLDAIQNIPISDSAAYAILEQGDGFSKVVVAMLSQYEDEHLQEKGLHALIRILRAAPNENREALVLLTYADCYRRVQGDNDAVAPKGSLGIDERSSGAIQAISHAVRRHSLVRRVQLAGCCALTEVAVLSLTCRTIAYDHGAITFITTGLRHRSSQAGAAIHDMASRAVSGFCAGKENVAFKEAFTSAGAVTELLNILQLWGHTNSSALELPNTTTRSCCVALRDITDGYPVASGQCVQSFSYHHLVRTMIVRREDVSVCTDIVSAMTSITRNAGAIAEKGLLDAKPLPEVLLTMQTHSDQPLFIRKALEFMESLGNFSSMREEIVHAGGIPFAADIIQQGGNDVVLLERACGVVEKLCRSHPKHQEVFVAHNGVISLAELLKSHQSLPGVVERALFALTSACSGNSRAQKEAAKAGVPEQIVRSIGAYSSKNAKVAAAGASATAALVVPRNAGMAQGFSKLKAPELIIRAMKKHPDSVVVQENGSAAISSVCEADPRIIVTLLKSGISSILVVGLQRFLHKQGAVVQIVRAMRAISNEALPEANRFKTKLLSDRSNGSSLSEIFHTALSYHKKSLPDTANVIISICATINRLCMRSVAFKNEIGKDGIVEELKRLVERTAEFRDLGALQPVLATICTLVLESEDNKNRFHAVGGVETILDVMQKWKSDTYVLEHCCAALRYSCNEHFGNCYEVKNHNGVRSILGVMELHPENVNVTLWCCLTLADLCKGDEELQSSPNVVQGIRKIISAMTMFSSNSRFLSSACEFLRAVAVDNVENQERIVRLGGRTAIVKALETHPDDNSLTESGAWALLLVQDVPDPRVSVDSNPPVGLVRRISRDIRGSGSASGRSNRSAGKAGLLGRKSKSFMNRRKPSTEGVENNPLTQTIAIENPASRTGRRSLLNLNFKRSSSSKGRKGRAGNAQVQELDDEFNEVERGADDGYGEYGSAPVAEGEFNPQID